MAIKSDKIIQVWDCKDVVEKAPKYDSLDKEKCKEDFSSKSSPMKDYKFDCDGKEPSAICCSWLPSDSNLFVIGFKSSHVAFFDYNSGNVEITHEFYPGVEEEGEVACIDAHELQPHILTGHLNGEFNIFDYKQKKVILTTDCLSDEQERKEGVYIQAIKYFNNCSSIIVGKSNGNINLYDSAGALLNVIEKAHTPKYDEGVNCLLNIQNSAGSLKSEGSTSNMPFFISGGADGCMKIFEHT